MTPELWAVLIPAVAGLLGAIATYLHSASNRARIAALEASRGQGPTQGASVAPRKDPQCPTTTM